MTIAHLALLFSIVSIISTLIMIHATRQWVKAASNSIASQHQLIRVVMKELHIKEDAK